MIRLPRICGISLLMLTFAGCATAPKPIYLTDAQEVTTKALEPVSVDDGPLRREIARKWADRVSAGKVDVLVDLITAQIVRTKRFTVLKEQDSVTVSGKNYIIEPHIADLAGPTIVNIPTDPTRKKIRFTAMVNLKVLYQDPDGNRIPKASFDDTRQNEWKRPVANLPLYAESRDELISETVEVGFKAAANKLAMAFNPSYVSGTVKKVSGRTAYLEIDTTKLEKMPVRKRTVEVLDEKDPNKVVATIESLSMEGGEPHGTIISMGGSVTVKDGTKVRALVNDLQE